MNKIPKAGKIWWLNFEPRPGVEEGGHDVKHNNYRRPALILINSSYNRYGMVAVFPVTSNSYMSNYLIPIKTIHHRTHGFIIPFKLQGLDFISRQGSYMDTIKPNLWPDIDKFVNSISQR